MRRRSVTNASLPNADVINEIQIFITRNMYASLIGPSNHVFVSPAFIEDTSCLLPWINIFRSYGDPCENRDRWKIEKAHWILMIKVSKVIGIVRIDKTTFSSVRALIYSYISQNSKLVSWNMFFLTAIELPENGKYEGFYLFSELLGSFRSSRTPAEMPTQR